MVYLVDTTILLRFLHSTDPRYHDIRDAVRELWSQGHQLRSTPQNFIEFWRSSTRPTTVRGGYGLTTVETDLLLRHAEQLFPILPDSPQVYSQWRQLVVTYRVSGRQAHDARLVATMLLHGVNHILTINTKDFSRYHEEGIVAIDPADV